MKTAYIDVDGYWGIAICYGYDVSNPEDKHDLWGYMRSFGMKEKDVKKALNILSNYNTGMSVSREDVRMSVVFISQATSESQFWDTASHELAHCVTHIIDYYGVGYDTEEAAYLTGYLMRKLVEEIGEPCYE